MGTLTRIPQNYTYDFHFLRIFNTVINFSHVLIRDKIPLMCIIKHIYHGQKKKNKELVCEQIIGRKL